jgi:hypothetical protein
VKIVATKHPLYRTWVRMRQRCYDPNDQNYKWYGARGIRVCKRWDRFDLFVKDMGCRPSGHTLDRKKVNRNYSPSNCKWSSIEEQNRNTRRNVHIELNGKRQTVAEWSRETGINPATLSRRVHKGWSAERVLA